LKFDNLFLNCFETSPLLRRRMDDVTPLRGGRGGYKDKENAHEVHDLVIGDRAQN